MTSRGSIRHNNRSFSATNVDRSRSGQNVTFCNEDLKKVYHELFNEALTTYNAKKKKTRDKIPDYYEHIQQSKQEKLFHEAIFQIGNLADCGCSSPGGERAADHQEGAAGRIDHGGNREDCPPPIQIPPNKWPLYLWWGKARQIKLSELLGIIFYHLFDVQKQVFRVTCLCHQDCLPEVVSRCIFASGGKTPKGFPVLLYVTLTLSWLIKVFKQYKLYVRKSGKLWIPESPANLITPCLIFVIDIIIGRRHNLQEIINRYLPRHIITPGKWLKSEPNRLDCPEPLYRFIGEFTVSLVIQFFRILLQHQVIKPFELGVSLSSTPQEGFQFVQSNIPR